MSEQVFAVPEQYVGKTLQQIGDMLGTGNLEGVAKYGGLSNSVPLTSSTVFRTPNDPGSAEVQFLQKNFSPTTEANLATNARMSAIQPAVNSYQEGIPEVQQKYATEKARLEGEKNPLIQRYDNLLAQIKGRTELETSREFGKRGISQQSGVYDQTLNAKINPYIQDIGLAREDDIRSIDSQISNLTGMEIEQVRAIRNAIAGLQAGAGNAGIEDANSMRNFNESVRQFNVGQNLEQDKFNFAKEGEEGSLKDNYLSLGEGSTLYDLLNGKALYTAPKTYKAAAGGNNSNIDFNDAYRDYLDSLKGTGQA